MSQRPDRLDFGDYSILSDSLEMKTVLNPAVSRIGQTVVHLEKVVQGDEGGS